MTTRHPPDFAGALPRVLGLRDVVLLYAVAIVSLQWLSTAAQMGPASLALWLLALAVFFVPSGLAVMELSSRYDGEGGLYVWSKRAFGGEWGFVAGWSYVVSNLVFFPTLLLFTAGCVGQVVALWAPTLREDTGLHVGVALAVLWLVVGANVLGLGRARHLTNACACAMGAVLVSLALAALACAVQFGGATDFGARLVPDVNDPALIKSFATMMFALVGLELAPLMGSEIVEPRRVIPRAIVWAGAFIAAFYLIGTSALLVALPPDQIDAIGGIPDAAQAVAARLGLPGLGTLLVAMMALASVGVLSAWVAAAVRLPYVVGIDRHLPAALGRLHPRWRSPHVALLTTGACTSILVVIALAGGSVSAAYQVLVDMTVALTFIPIALMFAALPALRRHDDGSAHQVQRVPGGRPGLFAVTALGLGSTLVAIGCALAPPQGEDGVLFHLKVTGGCALFIGLGFALRAMRARADRRAVGRGRAVGQGTTHGALPASGLAGDMK